MTRRRPTRRQHTHLAGQLAISQGDRCPGWVLGSLCTCECTPVYIVGYPQLTFIYISFPVSCSDLSCIEKTSRKPITKRKDQPHVCVTWQSARYAATRGGFGRWKHVSAATCVHFYFANCRIELPLLRSCWHYRMQSELATMNSVLSASCYCAQRQRQSVGRSSKYPPTNSDQKRAGTCNRFSGVTERSQNEAAAKS